MFSRLRQGCSTTGTSVAVAHAPGLILGREGARSLHSHHPSERMLHPDCGDISGKRVLVVGASGQIGTELVRTLREILGKDQVVASDIRREPEGFSEGPYRYADVRSRSNIERLVVENDIDWIVHNASLLSVTGEQNPQLALDVNIEGLKIVLEIARFHGTRVLSPSSIAAFGPSTPLDNTPNETIMRPTTVYGISKIVTELLGQYYNSKYGVDFRSLRYPGVISSDAPPGGGTTDYAVAIYRDAVAKHSYECYLEPDMELPMMFMPDCLRATIGLLTAPEELLSTRTYNVSGCSFTPEQQAESIRKFMPDFKITYNVDHRNKIAASWPNSLDDSLARNDWGWEHEYGLPEMTEHMLTALGSKSKQGEFQEKYTA